MFTTLDFSSLMRAQECRAKAAAIRKTADMLWAADCRNELHQLADDWDVMGGMGTASLVPALSMGGRAAWWTAHGDAALSSC